MGGKWKCHSGKCFSLNLFFTCPNGQVVIQIYSAPWLHIVFNILVVIRPPSHEKWNLQIVKSFIELQRFYTFSMWASNGQTADTTDLMNKVRWDEVSIHYIFSEHFGVPYTILWAWWMQFKFLWGQRPRWIRAAWGIIMNLEMNIIIMNTISVDWLW